ncbi:MAG: DUF885 domain-containing protein [Opitutaceae bacterium]|nr:DUF885 domain-containing protein [Opitutaceae bacterium]
MRGKLRFWPAAVLAVAQVVSGAADDFTARYEAIAADRGRVSDAERLHRLFAVDLAYTYAQSPETATYHGVSGYETRWTDNSLAAIAERRRNAGRPLEVLRTIERTALGPADQLNYMLFERQAADQLAGSRFPAELVQVTQLNGIHQDPALIFGMMPNGTPAELERQLARLRALPRAVDESIALLEEGLRTGFTPPQVTLREVPQQVRNQVPEEARRSPLLAGFGRLPPAVPPEAAQRLQAEAVRVYTEQVRPAYLRLEDFLTRRYLPGARRTTAATALPDGAAYYEWRVQSETTTGLTAREIHEIGLAEVKRIRAEMERVKTQAGFPGPLTEFFAFLRTDPRFFHTDKDELIRAYRDIAKRADPQLTRLFRTLPRNPYGVEPVPAFAEQAQTTAYYMPGAPDAGRPGVFFANTYALATRPKWEMQPLTLHEAVPGHHLQISLAQELDGVPDFRRHAMPTAFVEGWGLYAESLGEEMGFYTDPYDKFGQLTYEMWRAVRLVTDTGMHALGWSREQAIEYFIANAGKSEHDIVVEIDRYLVWPGQALAYKIGELKLKELRAYAARELGDRFDVRLFHDEVLRHGAIPLSVLESNIKDWVKRSR